MDPRCFGPWQGLLLGLFGARCRGGGERVVPRHEHRWWQNLDSQKTAGSPRVSTARLTVPPNMSLKAMRSRGSGSLLSAVLLVAALALPVVAGACFLCCRTDAFLSLLIGRSDMEWAREAERDNSTGHESAEGVVATGSGFSVVGQTNSRQPGIQHAWVLHFGHAPPPLWERTYGGPGMLGASGHAITALPRGGLVVAGTARGTGGGFWGWLVALSPGGDVLWERTPGEEGAHGFHAVSVLEDGSVVAGGSQDRVGWVVRVDSRGKLLWDVKLPQLERVTALVSLPAQRVAVLGTAETSTTGLGISRLMLLDSSGWASWQKQLPVEGKGELAALAPLPEGGFVATGRLSRPDSSDWSLWVVRMDPRGEILWEHVPEDPQVEAGRAITVLPDGGIVVAGFSWKEVLVDREAKVWRFSAEGSLLWEKFYGGARNDMGEGIAHLADDSLVVVGSTLSKGAGKTDVWTFGLSPEGDLLWEETFGAP
ncbi:conserved hypothetical protein [Stigmatella aurantiaca DW4/3-1]|uniref:Uncharacterized protein n=3 Tax=Stigmatella aurantiaca TaxID=41 RepID=Q09DF1_STIAD|nr:conserved hypothetical protein [Stigmatella aurantiaca DW4/3-1]